MTWQQLWKIIKKWLRLLFDPREFKPGFKRGYTRTKIAMEEAAIRKSSEADSKRARKTREQWEKNQRSR